MKTYFILGEDVSHVLLFCTPNLLFCFIVRVCLSDWIVKHLLALDKGVSYFLVRLWNALEIRLFEDVVVHVIFPLSITVGEASIFRSFSSVHFR